MCFSNLPIEFDDEGNPYLAEEADEVDGLPDGGCGCSRDVPIEEALEEEDPEAVFEEILKTMPNSVRDHVADQGRPDGDGQKRSAGGD